MFQLQEIESLKWPVHVNIPRDGGEVTKAKFDATFMIYDQDGLDKLTSEKTDSEILQVAVTGWGSDVKDHDDNPLEFTPENLAMMSKIPYVCRGMITALFEANQGIEIKN